VSNPRRATIGPIMLLGLATTGAPVAAQVAAPVVVDPETAPIRMGPVAIAPLIQLSNIGWDSNVLHENELEDPKGDMTATMTPAIAAAYRTPRIRMDGRGQLAFYYYNQLTDLRSLDYEYAGRAEVVLNRLTPFVDGSFISTRQRQNLEIDALERRRTDALNAGTDVRLTAKTTAGVFAGIAHAKYEATDTELARELNYDSNYGGVVFRYAATPLTTFAVTATLGHDEFIFSPERDADNFQIIPSVEFKPLALINGYARVGFRSSTFPNGDQPDFNSIVVAVDLQYTWRSRTQFGVGLQRDMQYSYIETQQDYVLVGISGSVTQRFAENWQVRGSVGRYRLNYRQMATSPPTPQPPGPVPPVQPPVTTVEQQALPDEDVWSFGLDAGYNLGRSRVGLTVEHTDRASDLAVVRGYERLRIGSYLTYTF
jgi:hypothetical protein